jgi:serine/threonine protein phosphatase PrpC
MTSLITNCPICGAAPNAADTFCEACGASLDAGSEPTLSPEVDLAGVGGTSHPGLVRPRNEDAFAAVDGDRGTVGVVCDGVASSSDGRVAADRAAAVTVSEVLAAMGGPWDAERAVRGAVEEARRAVADLAGQNGSPLRAPSCTLVAAVWDGSRVTVASVGDSRAYWLAPGDSRQLTVDDSWVREQVDAGLASESSAMDSAHAHAITNWLGADAPDASCRLTSFVPERRGLVVLCSDGLWNHFGKPLDLERLASFAADERPLEVARRLTEAALDAGGKDNVTVVVVEVDP